jgi:hypothetical protein
MPRFLFADKYSNTSGLNQSRADDPSGMPQPVILYSTFNHTQVFIQVTAIVILLAPYLGITSESVYVYPDYPEHYHDFQEVIHPENHFEAMIEEEQGKSRVSLENLIVGELVFDMSTIEKLEDPRAGGYTLTAENEHTRVKYNLAKEDRMRKENQLVYRVITHCLRKLKNN